MTYRALANAAVASIVAFAASSVPAWGQGKTTRIEFPRGSYCSTYAGQLSGDRQFLLELARGQTLVTRNLGPSYRIAVSGPTGMLSGWQAAPNQANYRIPQAGDYIVEVSAPARSGKIEFCAY